MSLEIQQREHEGIIILDLKGRLTVGQEATTFRERMQKLLPAGHNNIILNMEHVDYVDSTGLGALVMCFTSVQKAGGKVKLLNLTRRSIALPPKKSRYSPMTLLCIRAGFGGIGPYI